MWPFRKKADPRDVYETLKPALIGRLDALIHNLNDRMKIASCYDEEDRIQVARIIALLQAARDRLDILLYSPDPRNAENAKMIGEALAYIETSYTSLGTLTTTEQQCKVITEQVNDWESHI